MVPLMRLSLRPFYLNIIMAGNRANISMLDIIFLRAEQCCGTQHSQDTVLFETFDLLCLNLDISLTV